jgi:hypothetical protein
MNTVSKNGLSPDANRRDSRGFDSPKAGEPGAGESGPGEDTLRLIAGLPAPEGLADRVKAGLRNAPEAGRILTWPGTLLPARGWMYTNVARGAAAAAIVCVVAGGGWRIYSHVQQAAPANVIMMPPPVTPPGTRFGGANGQGRPNTPDGLVITHPQAPPSEVNTVQKMPSTPNTAPGGKAAKKKKAPHPVAAPVQ